jgi:hypothetical protein
MDFNVLHRRRTISINYCNKLSRTDSSTVVIMNNHMQFIYYCSKLPRADNSTVLMMNTYLQFVNG